MGSTNPSNMQCFESNCLDLDEDTFLLDILTKM